MKQWDGYEWRQLAAIIIIRWRPFPEYLGCSLTLPESSSRLMKTLRDIIVLPFYRWRNWGWEKWNDLPKVPEINRGKTNSNSVLSVCMFVLLQSQCSLYLGPQWSCYLQPLSYISIERSLKLFQVFLLGRNTNENTTGKGLFPTPLFTGWLPRGRCSVSVK